MPLRENTPAHMTGMSSKMQLLIAKDVQTLKNRQQYYARKPDIEHGSRLDDWHTIEASRFVQTSKNESFHMEHPDHILLESSQRYCAKQEWPLLFVLQYKYSNQVAFEQGAYNLHGQ